MNAAAPQVWLAFVLYLGATFVFAVLGHRKAKGGAFMEEFFVAGRSIGPWTLALTWIATMASGGSFIGVPALAHAYGWPLILWIGSYMAVATVGFGLFGRRVAEIGRRTGALTFPDLLRDRFESPLIGAVAAGAIVVLYIGYMVAQYVAGARVLEVVLGVPYLWGVFGFAATVGVYTAYGGFRTVAWTDAFQAVVMLIGVLVAVGFALSKVGGLDGLQAGLAAQDPELLGLPGPDGFLPAAAAFSFFVIWPFAGAGQPSLITRFLAGRDGATLDRAMFLAGLYILLLYPAIIVLGLAGRVLAPELAAQDHAMPATILAATPPWLAGFVLAAPLAAIMSTLSSFLLVSSSAIVRDLYQRNRREPMSESAARRLTHGSTLAVAALALLFALKPPPFLQYLVVFSGTGLAATFLVPTLMAIYWPKFDRLGCLAGMASGFCAFLAQYAAYGTKSIFGLDPFVPALAAAALGGWLGARFGEGNSREIEARYFGNGRGSAGSRAGDGA